MATLEDVPTGRWPVGLTPGQKLGRRYEIVSRIGRGAMGVVYKARDFDLEKIVALKILPAEVAHDPTAIDDLKREATLASELQHPNIVRIYDTDEIDGVRFIKMEFVDGISLAEHLRQKKALEEKEILELALPILDALAHAHSRKVIHRDLKPGNILLARDPATGKATPKIADFGFARLLEDTQRRLSNRTTGGTLSYMAPEQIHGLGADPRSDLYSFGAMLYELAVGHPPFYTGAIEYQILNEAPVPLAEAAPGLSVGVTQAIHRCLQKRIVDRFHGAQELRAALMAVPLPGAAQGRPAPLSPIASPSAVSKPEGVPEGFVPVGGDVDFPSGLPKRILHIETGIEMVLVPAGKFTMGSADNDSDADDEKPQHEVYLDAYWIGVTPVTNNQYRAFDDEHDSGDEEEDDDDEKPVMRVSWEDAKAFCARFGMRLPTEAEWEKAARGTDRRIYPWGREEPTPDHANYEGTGLGATSRVGSFPKGGSPYGCLDMAGNVCEWVSDWYSYGYYGESPSANPKGPSSGSSHVVRGGSYLHDSNDMRASFRDDDKFGSVDLTGFRCATTPARTHSTGKKLEGALEGFEAVGTDVELSLGLPKRILHIETGIEMVLVPAGEFVMGTSDRDPMNQLPGCRHEKPMHKVYLDAYWIGVTPVTNGQYRVWKKHDSGDGFDNDEQPVVEVSWEDAKEYCASFGMRLPTEAEWEKAARGTDRRIYPWGKEEPTPDHANYEGTGLGTTSRVGSFPKGASPYGCLDMAGNVREWVNDWYDDNYYASSPPSNPRGPSSEQKERVLRGSSWNDWPMYTRCASRHSCRYEYNYVGFRCAKDVN